MELTLVPLVSLAGALAGLAIPWRRARLAVLVITALAHLGLVTHLWTVPTPPAALDGNLALDPLGHLVLTLTSVCFAAIVVYLVQYRHLRQPQSPRTFLVPLLLVMLTAMSVICLVRNFAVLWIASGAMTLSVAPLIYLQRGQRTLEAAWKYLMLSSVGVAIALVGIFLVAIAFSEPSGESKGLLLDQVLIRAREGRFSAPWLKAGFIFLLVGFGTKVGLAPMHTWKPDTYAEAPTPIATLMATALTNCAFLCILRGYQVCVAAGLTDFAGQVLVVLGLFSMAIAAAFVVEQADAKRLLAYSGVEHMGIVALGVGIGGRAIWAALLHMIGHSFAKGLLFFATGNIVYTYKTKAIPEITGVIRRMPVSGVLLVCGFLATLGFPPFSIFVSELTMVSAAFATQKIVAASLALALILVVFMAVISLVLGMAQGPDPLGRGVPRERESIGLIAPPIAFIAFALALGLRIPPSLDLALTRAASVLGGGS
jgi:hydrogenase-4 component F